MQFLHFVAPLLPFLATAFAARKSSAPSDPFPALHSSSVASNAPLKLDEKSFLALTDTPRNHTAAVLFTALESRFGCGACTAFQPEWELVARSWLRGDQKGQGRLLFATIDFVDGRRAFESLGLTTAPLLAFYQPTTGPNAVESAAAGPLKLDFATGPQSAESLQTWIARHMPADAPTPPIYRPFNWLRFIAVTTLVLGGGTALVVAWPYVAPLLANRNLWAAGCMIAILLFTSGHMFNHIRGTPYVTADANGGLQYLAPGFQSQLGLESQIVAALYGILAFATVSLALKVPRIADPKSQQVAVFVWGALLFFVYSLLLSVFRHKNAGYPFWLPPF